MHRHLLPILILAAALAVAAAAAPGPARAAWCWPTCDSFGWLGPGTSTSNGCWYRSGEVCSGWNTWTANGINKACTPICIDGWTNGRVLYGFENTERIRGFYTAYAGARYVYPYQLSMGGYLRGQAAWAGVVDGSSSYASWIHVGAV